MRSDKILRAAFDYIDTPELVERVVRAEDGTGYLFTELGNLVGFRALNPLSGESVLPEYTEDVQFTGRGAIRNTIGYALGVLDESPGWVAALALELYNPDAVTMGTFGIGKVGKIIGLGASNVKRLGAGKSILKTKKVIDDVINDARLKDATPDELNAEILARGRDADVTGQIDESLDIAAMDASIEVQRHGQNIEELTTSVKELFDNADDIIRKSDEAVRQGDEAIDTTSEVARLNDQITASEARANTLAAEAVVQEKLLQGLEKSRLELPGKKGKAAKEVVEEVVEEVVTPPKPKAPEAPPSGGTPTLWGRCIKPCTLPPRKAAPRSAKKRLRG